MKISEKGLKTLIELEGFEKRVYLDSAGLPTIGVGHLLTRDELASGKIEISYESVKYSDGISEKQVMSLLRQDIERFEVVVRDCVKVPLQQYQFDVLCIFSFNIGVSAFKKSTLLRLLNTGNYQSVPVQLKRWVYSGGKKAPGLVNRRNRTAGIWADGYPGQNDKEKEVAGNDNGDSIIFTTTDRKANVIVGIGEVKLTGNWKVK